MITSPKFEHTAVVLQLDEKSFSLSSTDALQGLKPESATQLADLGAKGWELISVVPYSRSVLLPGSTGSMLGFFKRALVR